jgi:hypothetical protein
MLVVQAGLQANAAGIRQPAVQFRRSRDDPGETEVLIFLAEAPADEILGRRCAELDHGEVARGNTQQARRTPRDDDEGREHQRGTQAARRGMRRREDTHGGPQGRHDQREGRVLLDGLRDQPGRARRDDERLEKGRPIEVPPHLDVQDRGEDGVHVALRAETVHHPEDIDLLRDRESGELQEPELRDE